MPIDLKLTGKAKLFLNWMDEGADSLLDVGCASSFMLNLLGKKSQKSIGLDFDTEKLFEAKSKFGHNQYVCGSGEQLPFKNKTMDVITFFETLEHVENEQRFLKEIHRVSGPVAKAVDSEVSPYHRNTLKPYARFWHRHTRS